jgi:hypothetical protein
MCKMIKISSIIKTIKKNLFFKKIRNYKFVSNIVKNKLEKIQIVPFLQ